MVRALLKTAIGVLGLCLALVVWLHWGPQRNPSEPSTLYGHPMAVERLTEREAVVQRFAMAVELVATKTTHPVAKQFAQLGRRQ